MPTADGADQLPFASLTMTNPLPALAEKRNPAFAIVRMAKPFAPRRISCGMIEAKELKVWVAFAHSLGRDWGMGDETGMVGGW